MDNRLVIRPGLVPLFDVQRDMVEAWSKLDQLREMVVQMQTHPGLTASQRDIMNQIGGLLVGMRNEVYSAMGPKI